MAKSAGQTAVLGSFARRMGRPLQRVVFCQGDQRFP